MSQIVPWNSPGGAPCCCSESCFSDLANEPKPDFVDGTYIPINSSAYASIYAGGIYTANYEIDVFAESFSQLGLSATQTHFASGSGVELVSHASIPSEDRPCYDRFISEEITVSRNRTFFSPDGQSNDTYPTRLAFYRSLGTQNGSNFVSFTTCASPTESNVIVDNVGLGGQIGFSRLQGIGVFDFPTFLIFVAGNTDYGVEHLTGNDTFNSCGGGTVNDPFLPTVPTIDVDVSFDIAGSILTPVGLAAKACANSSLYGRLFLGATPPFSMNGSFSLDVVFTPTAP